MTKQQIIKYICEKYHNVMLITHDEMLEMKKKDLVIYLKQLQDRMRK